MTNMKMKTVFALASILSMSLYGCSSEIEELEKNEHIESNEEDSSTNETSTNLGLPESKGVTEGTNTESFDKETAEDSIPKDKTGQGDSGSNSSTKSPPHSVFYLYDLNQRINSDTQEVEICISYGESSIRKEESDHSPLSEKEGSKSVCIPMDEAEEAVEINGGQGLSTPTVEVIEKGNKPKYVINM